MQKHATSFLKLCNRWKHHLHDHVVGYEFSLRNDTAEHKLCVYVSEDLHFYVQRQLCWLCKSRYSCGVTRPDQPHRERERGGGVTDYFT